MTELSLHSVVTELFLRSVVTEPFLYSVEMTELFLRSVEMTELFINIAVYGIIYLQRIGDDLCEADDITSCV